jgi:hypothetical protein
LLQYDSYETVLFWDFFNLLLPSSLTESESVGVLVIAAIFFATRYVPFLATFGLRRHSSGSVVASLLSLFFATVLLFWGFIEYEIGIVQHSF